MLYSLAMRVEIVSTDYVITASWLEIPIKADSFEAAYAKALQLWHIHKKGGPRPASLDSERGVRL